MRHEVTLTVNGEQTTAVVQSRSLLVGFLREGLGLTGTHVGCDSTTCGACTVLLDGRAVKSCTVLTAAADGSEVLTVEGLASGEELSPVQEGFRQCHGLQCGFCTPGMVMASTSLLLTEPDPDEAEVREAVEGNLCRCTGYQMIVESVRCAARLGGAGTAAHAHADRCSSRAAGQEPPPPEDGGTPLVATAEVPGAVATIEDAVAGTRS